MSSSRQVAGDPEDHQGVGAWACHRIKPYLLCGARLAPLGLACAARARADVLGSHGAVRCRFRAQPAGPGSVAPTGTRRARLLPISPSRGRHGGRGWTRAASASRSGGSNAAAPRPTVRSQRRASRRGPRRGADLVARREQVAGVEAHAEPRAAACRLDQRRQLLEGAAERAAGAGRVLEVQRATVGLRQRLRDHLTGARDRLADVAVLAEPGCSTTPVAPIASPTRSECVSEASDFSRISGSSEAQLSSRRRGSARRRSRWPRAPPGTGEVVLGVVGRSPHARRLVEDLDRLGIEFGAALDRLLEPAGGRDMSADQHRAECAVAEWGD